MKRGLRVVQLLAPGEAGGAESVVTMLAEGLARRGHELHLGLTLDTGAPEHMLEERLGATPAELHSWRLPPRAYRRERGRVQALCRRLEPHVLHTHGYRADVVGALAVGSSTPLVSTAHGFTEGGAKNRFYEWLQRRVYRRFDTIVAVSRSVEERLTRGGVPTERVRVVPNAWIGPEAIERAKARRELGLPTEGFVVGWVGRLSREKGLDLLVDALRDLADLPLEVAIVGDGPERSALEKRVATAAIPVGRVRWLGVVPDAGRLFRAFDLFALSSRTEGTPIVLFEAMAAGVPIVATRVGGVPDVVGDAEAFLAAPADPGALARAIREAVLNPAERERRRDAARRRLREAFEPESWLDAYEEIYLGAAGLAESVGRAGGPAAVSGAVGGR